MLYISNRYDIARASKAGPGFEGEICRESERDLEMWRLR
jgi:hypothetical protein